MTTQPRFRCSYELDDRVDKELANLCQKTYRSLQNALTPQIKLRRGENGLPDPVQYYLLYTTALVYGAADALVTLVLHNLGREARLLERQIFECSVRAEFYANNPDVARLALLSTPFQEKKLLDQLGYDKTSQRYLRISKTCDEVAAKHPESRIFREPSLLEMIRRNKDIELTRFYTLHYRLSSQLAHATLAGVGSVWGKKGLSFDSRLSNPNWSLEMVCVYLLSFMNLLNEHLEVGIKDTIGDLTIEWKRVEKRLRGENPHQGQMTTQASPESSK